MKLAESFRVTERTVRGEASMCRTFIRTGYPLGRGSQRGGFQDKGDRKPERMLQECIYPSKLSGFRSPFEFGFLNSCL